MSVMSLGDINEMSINNLFPKLSNEEFIYL